VKFDVSEADQAVLVSLSGEIVTREDQQAASGLIDERLADGRRTFILDLSQVPYLSSLGIAVLVAAYVKIQRAGGSLRLVNPRPKVAKILEMTKVADMFRTYASVEEALGTN
jgi:anti-sigma B factor antagonist